MALRDFQSFLPLGLHRAAPVLRIMKQLSALICHSRVPESIVSIFVECKP
jgi:hypothetical protein